jgi:hypothetical protein
MSMGRIDKKLDVDIFSGDLFLFFLYSSIQSAWNRFHTYEIMKKKGNTISKPLILFGK